MRPKVWTDDEVNEFAIADAVLNFFRWHQYQWNCDCDRTTVLWNRDRWWIDGSGYKNFDGTTAWIVCHACDWKIRILDQIRVVGVKSKGLGN